MIFLFLFLLLVLSQRSYLLDDGWTELYYFILARCCGTCPLEDMLVYMSLICYGLCFSV